MYVTCMLHVCYTYATCMLHVCNMYETSCTKQHAWHFQNTSNVASRFKLPVPSQYHTMGQWQHWVSSETWIIAAAKGHDLLIKYLIDAFREGFVKKEVLAATLRAHKEAEDATKSPQREAAAENNQDWIVFVRLPYKGSLHARESRTVLLVLAYPK